MISADLADRVHTFRRSRKAVVIMSSHMTNSVSSLAQSIGEIPPENVLFGRSEAMQGLRSRLDKVAAANVPVLIHGESGTGKDIIARLVHTLSPWKTGPFVKVNCPAIPGTLLESELFGYERGAFTGAYGSKPGRVEMAHRGTLFLDEISELDMSLQSKLLQLLQDGQFCRIGAQADKKVEVRIVCATNRNLEEEIENGTFRQDLFYRINVVTLHTPPLRSRCEDILPLAQYFVRRFGEKCGRKITAISPEARALLRSYGWPGNVRELENAMERAVVLGSTEMILVEDLPEVLGEGQQPAAESGVGLLHEAVNGAKRAVVQRAFEQANDNHEEAARLLGVHPNYLYRLMKNMRLQMASRRTTG